VRDGLQELSNQTHVMSVPEARREPKRADQHKGIFTNIATHQSKAPAPALTVFFLLRRLLVWVLAIAPVASKITHWRQRDGFNFFSFFPLPYRGR